MLRSTIAAVVLFASACCLPVLAEDNQPSSQQQSHEYLVRWPWIVNLEKDLNAAAAQGWRVHTIVDNRVCPINNSANASKIACAMVVFERPKK